jgi:hypothetical protein
MRKTMKVVTAMLLFGIAFTSQAATLDISEATGGFAVSDSANVTFGTNVNSATLLEDAAFGLTYLSNDPSFGDSGVFIPSNISTLSFDYDFFTSGSDSFEVKLLDSTDGASLFSFLFDSSSAGTGNSTENDVTIDLAGLGVLNGIIGLEFNLFSNIDDSSFDSTLNISDVRLNTASSTVPAPPTLILLILGLSAWSFSKRYSK